MACLVLPAFEPNALLESNACLCIRVSFYLRLSRASQLRSTSHQGERLVLLLLFVWLCFFCWVCFGCVLVACVVLWFGLLGRFTEPAFHPLLLAIR